MFAQSIQERKKQKFDSLVNKRILKPGCDEACFHKCSTKITKERRTFLNTEFWKLQTLKERNAFMLQHVSIKAIKQRTVLAEDTFRRNNSFQYIIPKDIKGTSQIICKTFFSTTLGYEKN